MSKPTKQAHLNVIYVTRVLMWRDTCLNIQKNVQWNLKYYFRFLQNRNNFDMEIAKYVIFGIRDCVLEIDKMIKSDEADPIPGNHIIHSQGKFDLLNPQFALDLFILQLRGFIKLSRMWRRISESKTSETVAMASSSESFMIS